MPRRGFIAKRDVLPDPMYNSKVVTKLVNNIMLDGKKRIVNIFVILLQKSATLIIAIYICAKINTKSLTHMIKNDKI